MSLTTWSGTPAFANQVAPACLRSCRLSPGYPRCLTSEVQLVAWLIEPVVMTSPRGPWRSGSFASRLLVSRLKTGSSGFGIGMARDRRLLVGFTPGHRRGENGGGRSSPTLDPSRRHRREGPLPRNTCREQGAQQHEIAVHGVDCAAGIARPPRRSRAHRTGSFHALWIGASGRRLLADAGIGTDRRPGR